MVSLPYLGLAQGVGACFGFTNCVEQRYYVSGKTVDELIESLNTEGPQNAWGETRISFASSDTTVYQKTDDGKVTLLSIGIEPILRISLPEWREYSQASGCLKLSWDTMYENLSHHEKQHAKIAVSFAKKMEDAAMSVRYEISEAALRAAIWEALSPLLNQHNLAQDNFDRRTGHGARDLLNPVFLDLC
jgi:predicted secreted Zn-dependent protease